MDECSTTTFTVSSLRWFKACCYNKSVSPFLRPGWMNSVRVQRLFSRELLLNRQATQVLPPSGLMRDTCCLHASSTGSQRNSRSCNRINFHPSFNLWTISEEFSSETLLAGHLVLTYCRLLFQRTMGCTGQVIWCASSTPWWRLTRSNNLLLPFKVFFPFAIRGTNH